MENNREYVEKRVKHIIALTNLTMGSFSPKWKRDENGERIQIESMKITLRTLDSHNWSSWNEISEEGGGYLDVQETCEFEDGKTDHQVGGYAADIICINKNPLLILSCTQLESNDFLVRPSFAEMRLTHPSFAKDLVETLCVPFDDMERSHARKRAYLGSGSPHWTGKGSPSAT